MSHRTLRLCASLVLFTHGLHAADYFVAPSGADANPGTQKEQAFRTVQKGVDALHPGDTLTIAPGEYRESVRRDGIGGESAETVIRAEFPGTVLLRGDMPVAEARKLEGYRSVYWADFDSQKEVQVLNEIDTLTVLERKPNLAELDYLPGFYQDRKAGKLYFSSSDRESAASHQYTAGVIPGHGIYFSGPTRVVLDGLAVTGFNTNHETPRQDQTFKGAWGIFLLKSKGSTLRDCFAYLNGQGIGVNSLASQEENTGDNVIERCTSWANASQFGEGDTGGISLYSPRRDEVRQSLSFLNKEYGIHIYHGWKSGTDERNKAVLRDNLAWGNYCDFKIKTGEEYLHAVERSAGPGLWSVKNTDSCLIGTGEKGHPVNNILLDRYPDLDPGAEFADPANHDYRLQATSRFRAAGENGRDPGPAPYEKNVFFVGGSGNDAADGLALKSAWKTLARAASMLKPGDTLYLLPGVHEGGGLSFKGTPGKPVSVRGRGGAAAVVRGGVALGQSHDVRFERIAFEEPASLEGGRNVRFHNCRFASLTARKVDGLAITHGTFVATDGAPDTAGLDLAGCAKVFLSGNRFETVRGPAIRLDRAEALLYCGDNAYANLSQAISVNANAQPAPVPASQMSLLGYPFGNYPTPAKDETLKLMAAPALHSASATTANVEWIASRPASCEIAWGPTPECENRETFVINRFGSFSLTGLKPGTTYYFRVLSLREPGSARDVLLDTPPDGRAVPVSHEPLTFTTAKANAKPATYHVAPDGDDANPGTQRATAWRTLQHAADRVNAGDTVLIAGGAYSETVRLRATGEKEAPITFRAAPGEKVEIEGADGALSQGFVAGGKSHLRFDGLYFSGFNAAPVLGLMPLVAGEFCLYAGSDIQITRCFSDGRRSPANGPRFVSAWAVNDLLIQNCVVLAKMSAAITLMRCPDARIENNASVRSSISALVIDNRPDQKATLKNNLFTDMLKKKADLNISLLLIEKGAPLAMENNGFFVRSFPPRERNLFSWTDHAAGVGERMTLPAYEASAGDSHSLFIDPAFAGIKKLPEAKPGAFPPDRFADRTVALDFDAFFPTEPETVRRGIGLQPEAFRDFSLPRPARSESSPVQ